VKSDSSLDDVDAAEEEERERISGALKAKTFVVEIRPRGAEI